MNETQIEFLAALRTSSLNNAFLSLNGDLDKHILVDFDDSSLFRNIDIDGNGLIDKIEILSHFEHPLYYLVLEEVLSNGFKTLNNTVKSPIDYFFPSENSTIGEKEIGALLKKFDLDGDKSVTRSEIVQLF